MEPYLIESYYEGKLIDRAYYDVANFRRVMKVISNDKSSRYTYQIYEAVYLPMEKEKEEI